MYQDIIRIAPAHHAAISIGPCPLGCVDSFEQLAASLTSTADDLRSIDAGAIRPTQQLLIAIASALHVRLGELIDGTVSGPSGKPAYHS